MRGARLYSWSTVVSVAWSAENHCMRLAWSYPWRHSRMPGAQSYSWSTLVCMEPAVSGTRSCVELVSRSYAWMRAARLYARSKAVCVERGQTCGSMSESYAWSTVARVEHVLMRKALSFAWSTVVCVEHSRASCAWSMVVSAEHSCMCNDPCGGPAKSKMTRANADCNKKKQGICHRNEIQV